MSRIYEPYRALGLCASDVPFVIKHAAHSNTNYVIVPVCERFNVYKVRDPVKFPIRAFTASGNFIYAAAADKIYIYRGSRYILHELSGHEFKITQLLTIPNYLISVDENNYLKVWDLKSLKIVSELEFSNKSFHITVIFHPIKYQNKILLGSAEGPLQLWNVISRKQLYWFKGFGCSVTCIQQAPAIDVCAIGLFDGRIILHNLKYDIKLLNFVQDGGAITTIEFRVGMHGLRSASNMEENTNLILLPTEDQDVYMVTGCESGMVNCWQLKDQGKSRPVGQGRYIHWGRIVSMYCIPGGDATGAIVTSGSDNCIKVSYFDRPDGGPRTEYRRAGHMEPPNRILFWPGSSAGGSLLVSAGKDSILRIFSTFNQNLDKSLGRAYAPGAPDRRKASSEQRSAWLLPGIVHLDACSTRAEAWDNLVAVHENRRQVTTWNFMNSTRGRHWLDPEKFQGRGGEAKRLFKHTYATSVHMTNCGNFVLIGYSNGDVYKFNIQSGLERGSYGLPHAHDHSIVGVFVNQVNRLTLTIGGSQVRFWSFHNHDLLDSVELPTLACLTRFHRDNDILAIALTNSTIILIDLTSRKCIRRFLNPENHPCVDMTMSSDGRWLVSAHHGDTLIKTWDIVDSKLIDCFRVQLPITSIAFSPANEFLATTHANSLGVYLWDNRATYRYLYLQPLAIDYLPSIEESSINLPTRSMVPTFKDDRMDVGIRDQDESLMDIDENDEEQTAIGDEHTYISPHQIQGELATLCGLPSSYFTTLMNLDLIRERNQGLTSNQFDSSDQTNGQMPFFLPVIETDKGIIWHDDTENSTNPVTDENQIDDITKSARKRRKKRQSLLDQGDGSYAIEPVPGLMAKLKQAKQTHEFDQLMRALKSLGPSALDLEIRLLVPSHLGDDFQNDDNEIILRGMKDSNDRLNGFLRLLITRLEHKLDVDFACVCLEILLQRHGDVLLSQHKQLLSSRGTDMSQIVAMITDEKSDIAMTDSTWNLIKQAVTAKTKAQQTLTARVTRSICLVDFIRNPTTSLQF